MTTWVTVKTGLFGTSESFVPLDSATQNGNDIVVPHTKDKVKDAPRVAPDGHLEPEKKTSSIPTTNAPAALPIQARIGPPVIRTPPTTRPRAGPSGGTPQVLPRDDAMTRSEERLNVGTEKQETSRARLRKYVVTENVTTTVPIQREEVRIEREPITDANIGEAMDGPAISEEEHEVILHQGLSYQRMALGSGTGPLRYR
jgi:hypothetical protein